MIKVKYVKCDGGQNSEVYYNDTRIGDFRKVRLKHGTFFETYDIKGNYIGSFISKRAASEELIADLS